MYGSKGLVPRLANTVTHFSELSWSNCLWPWALDVSSTPSSIRPELMAEGRPNILNLLDSGLRCDDGRVYFWTFYEPDNISGVKNPKTPKISKSTLMNTNKQLITLWIKHIHPYIKDALYTRSNILVKRIIPYSVHVFLFMLTFFLYGIRYTEHLDNLFLTDPFLFYW